MAIKGVRRGCRERFFERRDARGIRPADIGRVEDILLALDGPNPLQALSAPAFRLHPLKGDRKALWSAKVSGRLRIVFRLRGEDVYDVDLTDYH